MVPGGLGGAAAAALRFGAEPGLLPKNTKMGVRAVLQGLGFRHAVLQGLGFRHAVLQGLGFRPY